MDDVGHSIARFIHRTGIWIALAAVALILVVVVVFYRQSAEKERIEKAWNSIADAKSTDDRREVLAKIDDKLSTPFLYGSARVGWSYAADTEQGKLTLAESAFTNVTGNSKAGTLWHGMGRMGQAMVALDSGNAEKGDDILTELSTSGHELIKALALQQKKFNTEAREFIKKLSPSEKSTGQPKPE